MGREEGSDCDALAALDDSLLRELGNALHVQQLLLRSVTHSSRSSVCPCYRTKELGVPVKRVTLSVPLLPRSSVCPLYPVTSLR